MSTSVGLLLEKEEEIMLFTYEDSPPIIRIGDAQVSIGLLADTDIHAAIRVSQKLRQAFNEFDDALTDFAVRRIAERG